MHPSEPQILIAHPRAPLARLQKVTTKKEQTKRERGEKKDSLSAQALRGGGCPDPACWTS